MINSRKTGIILANLGTPEQPEAASIRRYLAQFLSDPRVIDLPAWKWQPILRAIILPRRAKHVAENYRSIWTEQGSPLLAISREQQSALRDYLHKQGIDAEVELGMTYGTPGISDAVRNLIRKQVQQIIVLPLYPQYSSTTTASVFDAFARALKQQRHIPPFEFIHSYHLNRHYIAALAETIRKNRQQEEYLLFSFHGIPLRYVQEGDYYPEHCRQTAAAVAAHLKLNEHQWGLTFQSRFGKESWLQPYTDEFLRQAPARGIKNIALICPGFAADCLETLEEIAQENRQRFLACGGDTYRYIPALNAEEIHIQMMAELIMQKICRHEAIQ
ncbi:ferrochelatase [Mesocricetibacter intestinalis]|uniref:Ferrochelatase n=1 Tax=Mesocricetibacter intestinalis TaxID=1521930 RepID=A0A4R6VGT0_9PAST|nr:ferrochelatase [Mesocricetibacter intestinalis]TDQ57175.1 ferrochelatase [Mesocricetibacter intestinalis]